MLHRWNLRVVNRADRVYIVAFLTANVHRWVKPPRVQWCICDPSASAFTMSLWWFYAADSVHLQAYQNFLIMELTNRICLCSLIYTPTSWAYSHCLCPQSSGSVYYHAVTRFGSCHRYPCTLPLPKALVPVYLFLTRSSVIEWCLYLRVFAWALGNVHILFRNSPKWFQWPTVKSHSLNPDIYGSTHGLRRARYSPFTSPHCGFWNRKQRRHSSIINMKLAQSAHQ